MHDRCRYRYLHSIAGFQPVYIYGDTYGEALGLSAPGLASRIVCDLKSRDHGHYLHVYGKVIIRSNFNSVSFQIVRMFLFQDLGGEIWYEAASNPWIKSDWVTTSESSAN